MLRRSGELTDTSQVVKRYHSIVNCAMNVGDLSSIDFSKFGK